jgi:hypothetical protein
MLQRIVYNAEVLGLAAGAGEVKAIGNAAAHNGLDV